VSDPGAFRCAAAALRRGDPLVGSAPPARTWLLLEHPGPWRVDAVAGSGIDSGVLGSLTSAAGRRGARILLIRRPGRVSASPKKRWFLVGPDGTRSAEWASDRDLLHAVAALDDPAREPGRPAAPVAQPLLLVCTHGVHDTCCAMRGRPVAAALAEYWPDAVWECSHVGGDRFAPNVVVLPDGYYYGQVDPESAVATVRAHLAGAVDARWLRGMSAYPPPVQAAVVGAYARFGPLAPGAVTVVESRRIGPEGGHGWTEVVELAVPGEPVGVRAHVLAVRRPEAQLTCRAVRETPATEYEVTWSAAGVTG